MMLWLFLLWTLLSVLFLPLRLQSDVHLSNRKAIRLHVSFAGFEREWILEAIRTPQGHRLVVARPGQPPRKITSQDIPGPAAKRLISALRQSKRCHRFLRAHLHPERAYIQLLLHSDSAAATALYTGALRSALTLLPAHWQRVMSVRILPDFIRNQSTLQARCIFSLRLGTLIITAGLLLASLAAQVMNREAQETWNTPSEN